MNNEKLITIITVVKNDEQNIEKCIRECFDTKI